MKETGLKFPGFGPNSLEIFSRWYFEQFPEVIDRNKEGFALPDIEEPKFYLTSSTSLLLVWINLLCPRLGKYARYP